MKTKTLDDTRLRRPRVTVDAVYPHPPERVWRALTDPKELARWLLPGDFEPTLGSRFRFRADSGAGGGTIRCEVIELIEARRLAYTWQDDADPAPTVVTWTLEPIEGGTRLRLEHAAPINVAGRGGVLGSGIAVRLLRALAGGASRPRRPRRLRQLGARSLRRRPTRTTLRTTCGTRKRERICL